MAKHRILWALGRGHGGSGSSREQRLGSAQWRERSVHSGTPPGGVGTRPQLPELTESDDVPGVPHCSPRKP